jgi:hypothetical protein
MKKVRHLLSLFAVGLLCTGCWPLRLTISPGASGVLMDAQAAASSPFFSATGITKHGRTRLRTRTRTTKTRRPTCRPDSGEAKKPGIGSLGIQTHEWVGGVPV